jgi:hypothetical protein
MTTNARRKVWRLDPDGRLISRANGLAWRVVAADRDRVDASAEYLFCAPDFLFPVDDRARALRLESLVPLASTPLGEPAEGHARPTRRVAAHSLGRVPSEATRARERSEAF